ncbi:MAG: hypothetical protein ACOYVD_13290 [Bacillota bacterium]
MSNLHFQKKGESQYAVEMTEFLNNQLVELQEPDEYLDRRLIEEITTCSVAF